MFCMKCGMALEEEYNFCMNCGMKIESAVSVPVISKKEQLDGLSSLVSPKTLQSLQNIPENK